MAKMTITHSGSLARSDRAAANRPLPACPPPGRAGAPELSRSGDLGSEAAKSR